MLTSSSDAGSVFTLYLPTHAPADANVSIGDSSRTQYVAQAQRVAMPALESVYLEDDREALSDSDRSLLVVEDDRAFAKILRDMARKRGYKAIVTNRGSEVVALAGKYAPCGILLDLGLVDTQGDAVLRELKDDAKTARIPVHVISAQDVALCPVERATSILTKPVTRDELTKIFASLQVDGDKLPRVLVVGDDRDYHKALERSLSGMGAEIAQAESGEAALRMMEGADFACVILDLALPDISGLEVLERLSAVKQGHKPPVIVHTGRALTDEERRKLSELAARVVMRGEGGTERLLEDVALFLHSVEASLPREHREVPHRRDATTEPLKGTRVLLVEDDTRNIFALTRALSDAGMVVQSATNGKMGIEKLEADAYDLVLMDVMMPVMDGLAATRAIRQREEYKDLPIIALTAKAMPKDRVECIAAGASDYMSKPIDTQRLLAMSRMWLSRAQG